MLYWILRGLLDWAFPPELEFTLVKVEGLEFGGKIKMVKMEFDQMVEFVASPVDRKGRAARIEEGSASWSIIAQDADGNDVSDALTVEVDETYELRARVYSSDVECTAVLTLRADGDEDMGETVDVVATADIIVDAPNVVALSLSNSQPVDFEEAPAEEEPVEEPVDEPVDEPVEEPVDEPVEEPVEDVPSEEPVEEVPAEEPADEFPSEDQPAGDEPAGDVPAEDTPVFDEPSENTSQDERPR